MIKMDFKEMNYWVIEMIYLKWRIATMLISFIYWSGSVYQKKIRGKTVETIYWSYWRTVKQGKGDQR